MSDSAEARVEALLAELAALLAAIGRRDMKAARLLRRRCLAHLRGVLDGRRGERLDEARAFIAAETRAPRKGEPGTAAHDLVTAFDRWRKLNGLEELTRYRSGTVLAGLGLRRRRASGFIYVDIVLKDP